MTKKNATKSDDAPNANTAGYAEAMNHMSTSAPAGSEISSLSSATTANDADMVGPSQASDFIIQDNSESDLLKLPNEIKLRIWTLAVTVDEPITPIQLRPKSNKFIWSRSQIDKAGDTKNLAAVPKLTAVELAKVCRQIYQEISATHLFYTVNHFDFKPRVAPIITYLVAITKPRREAIRSVSTTWDRYGDNSSAQAFTLLASCKGLQVLELEMDYMMTCGLVVQKPKMTQLPGFKQSLSAVQGLKTLRMTVEKVPEGSGPWFTSATALRLKCLELCGEVEIFLKEQLKQPRTGSYNLDWFRKAFQAADLNIHGDGRLGEDKKPGVVSSRTRQQIRNVNKLADDGTLPDPETPRYNLNGEFAWYIYAIEGSREVHSDDGIQTVEFNVKCIPHTSEYHHGIPADQKKFVWEDVSVLNYERGRESIIRFYEKERKASGKQLVLDTWKLRAWDDDREKRMAIHWEKRLEGYIRRHALLEQHEAEQAARTAHQVAKAAKGNRKGVKVNKIKPAKAGT